MSDLPARLPPGPRSVRPTPDPLGLFIRAGRNDHHVILNLIASGDTGCFGVVFDPTASDRQQELKEQVLAHRLDAILDTKAMQMALPGACTPAMGMLPWGSPERLQQPSDFEGLPGRRLLASIAEYVVEQGYTEVLAPTHLLRDTEDPWLIVDVESTRILRESLDRQGGRGTPILYPLAIPYSVFRKQEQRAKLVSALASAGADAIWLRVDGFGAHASPTAVRTYIAAAADFHSLGRRLVGDYLGGATGLALLAFGAIGGISHGVTFLEEFNAASWRNRRTGTPFAPKRRVYIPTIDAMITTKEAEALIGASPQAKATFLCRDTHCCPRGMKDMLGDPARHFLVQRMGEVAEIGRYPESLRPQRYLDLRLRPATDRAVQATSLSLGDELLKKMYANRKRLDKLRVGLGSHIEKSPPRSFALAPETRAARERRAG